MNTKTKYLILLFFSLSLCIFKGNHQRVQPSFQKQDIFLKEQVSPLDSRGLLRPESQLIVMTFNIAHGVNRNKEEALDSIIQEKRNLWI